jgi:hypothetical protein
LAEQYGALTFLDEVDLHFCAHFRTSWLITCIGSRCWFIRTPRRWCR